MINIVTCKRGKEKEEEIKKQNCSLESGSTKNNLGKAVLHLKVTVFLVKIFITFKL